MFAHVCDNACENPSFTRSRWPLHERDSLPAGLLDCLLLTLIVFGHAIVAKLEAKLIIFIERLLPDSLPNAILDKFLSRGLFLASGSMHRILNLLDRSADVFRVVAYAEI